MMKSMLLILMGFALFSHINLMAQSYRASVNEGNEHYRQQNYDDAGLLYSRGAEVKPERIESWFNAGAVAYRTEDIKAALEFYENAGKRARSREELASTLYNAGNVFLHAADKQIDNPVLQKAEGSDAGKLRMEGYKQAIELYKQALKLNPRDDDARYNLMYARKKLEELQQDPQKQDQDKDQQQQEQDRDENEQDKSKQDQQQQQDHQQQQQQQQQQDAQRDEQQAQPKPEQSMTKQQAEQILRALERQERDLQREKMQEIPVRVRVDRDW